MPNEKKYDRATQDIGNILGMEHVNVTVPDQEIASTFYISGLGFTRDPYMMVGPGNMWVNVGQQQDDDRFLCKLFVGELLTPGDFLQEGRHDRIHFASFLGIPTLHADGL